MAHLRRGYGGRLREATGYEPRATKLRAMLRARLYVHRLRFRSENLLDSTPFLPFISIMYLMQQYEAAIISQRELIVTGVYHLS